VVVQNGERPAVTLSAHSLGRRLGKTKFKVEGGASIDLEELSLPSIGREGKGIIGPHHGKGNQGQYQGRGKTRGLLWNLRQIVLAAAQWVSSG